MIVLSSMAALLAATRPLDHVAACCAVYPLGKPVVNADQTVIILWDAATKTQHFIRQASFQSAADDFGFLIPSPTQPELAESGDRAFPYLRKLTEPETKAMPRRLGIGCGCSAAMPESDTGAPALFVKVLEEKLVAGFNASVLEANSTAALVRWLRDNGYAFSPEVEAWAKPYVDAGWKITALKVAKNIDEFDKKVSAAALRMSFKTERPIFPYREPDYKSVNESLGAKRRLLRIYFLADGRFEGELGNKKPWSGQVAWAGKLSAAERARVLDLLKLPATTGPTSWWLTEFEDDWSYQLAAADLYFSRSVDQSPQKRPPVMRYVATPPSGELSFYAVLATAVLVPTLARWRRR
jgi:hypothetical protein